jgi:pimeloyl-ACP methyl ester carboxylesterase
VTPAWFERGNLDVQEFSAAGHRTFAVVEGKAEAFPVIFLHGLPGGAFVWAPLIGGIGRRRRVIVPDAPGWGRSYSPYGGRDFDGSPAAWQEWLRGLLAAQTVNRFDLVAHGSAVWPAMDFFCADPARVRRLALVNARFWGGAAPDEPPRFWWRRARWTAASLDRWQQRHLGATLGATDGYRTDFQMVLGPPSEQRTAWPLVAADYAPRFAAMQSALENYHGALLLIWGDQDGAADGTQSETMTARLDRPEVHRLAGAGRFPMLEQAEQCAAIFRDFLAD